MADKKVAEQYYAPPPKLGKWEGFKLFLWNSETSQCLGRTGSSWDSICCLVQTIVVRPFSSNRRYPRSDEFFIHGPTFGHRKSRDPPSSYTADE